MSRLVNLMSDPAIAIDPERRVSLVLDEMHKHTLWKIIYSKLRSVVA